MKDFKIVTTVKVFKDQDLPEEYKAVVDAAKEATMRSYAPYSKFRVGAAILLANGEIISGSNQENVAYPSGTCAERTACFYAHAAYPDQKFKAIAIAARDTDGEFCQKPISPCGACRQALLEYETIAGESVKVLLAGKDEIYMIDSISSLLPLAFFEFK